jgi:hypothetical protein
MVKNNMMNSFKGYQTKYTDGQLDTIQRPDKNLPDDKFFKEKYEGNLVYFLEDENWLNKFFQKIKK